MTKSEHVVKAKDVQIAKNKCKLMFVLHSSKTHTRGDKLQIIKISTMGIYKCTDLPTNIYPFRVLKQYLQVCKKTGE